MKPTVKTLLLVLACFAIFSGCSPSPRATAETSDQAQVADLSQHQEEIAQIIRDTPKAIEILDFLNKMGASYIYDITLPLSHAERFETTTDLCLATGVYFIDMWYANMFKRYDMVVQTASTIDLLAEKVGILNEIPQHARIKLHENNIDSLDFLLRSTFSDFHKVTQQKSSPREAMLFLGANIEGMYLLSQLTLYARENQAMTDYLMQRGRYAENLLRLLEIMSANESVRPYYEKMQPIVTYFQTHSALNQEELKEVADMIEGIRNQMLL